jgi:Zn-dependent protease with chaperone function
MTGNRTFVLALGLAAAALLAVGGLVAVYGPCLTLGARCLTHAVDVACRLLHLLHLPPVVGALVAGLAAGLLIGPLASLVSLLRRAWRTRALAAEIHRARSPLPALVASSAARWLGRSDALDLVAAATPFAFTYGLLAPRVCLSTALVERLTPDQLAAVLLHEGAHARRRDPLRALSSGSLARGLVMLPVLRDLDAHLRLRQEIEADAAAIAGVGVRALAGALHHLLGGGPPAGWQGAATSGMSPNRRIDHLLGRDDGARLVLHPPRVWMSVGLALAALCLLLI